jgi:hypothetical protein
MTSYNYHTNSFLRKPTTVVCEGLAVFIGPLVQARSWQDCHHHGWISPAPVSVYLQQGRRGHGESFQHEDPTRRTV